MLYERKQYSKVDSGTASPGSFKLALELVSTELGLKRIFGKPLERGLENTSKTWISLEQTLERTNERR